MGTDTTQATLAEDDIFITTPQTDLDELDKILSDSAKDKHGDDDKTEEDTTESSTTTKDVKDETTTQSPMPTTTTGKGDSKDEEKSSDDKLEVQPADVSVNEESGPSNGEEQDELDKVGSEKEQ